VVTSPSPSQEPEVGPKVVAPAASARLIVARSGEGMYRTVRDALQHARPGAHILVRDDILEEQLVIRGNNGLGKDVIIEANCSSGQPVIWRTPANLQDGQPLLELSDIE